MKDEEVIRTGDLVSLEYDCRYLLNYTERRFVGIVIYTPNTPKEMYHILFGHKVCSLSAFEFVKII